MSNNIILLHQPNIVEVEAATTGPEQSCYAAGLAFEWPMIAAHPKAQVGWAVAIMDDGLSLQTNMIQLGARPTALPRC